MDQQLIGQTLLGCEIQSVIGRGAAGTVFLARHLQIDCLRAIKVLKPHLASDPETVERFRSEARSAANIRHENLVTLHNADEGEGYFAYVMEYVEGQTLAQRVEEGGALDPHEAVDLLCQVSAGLAVAHKAGITHRDIKPDNLLLTASGQIKVADFGLSHVRDGQRLTQQGKAVGTPPYMSPEQCRGQAVDARSDLYSLGLVGYYLLTDTEPMLGEDAMATMYNQVNEDPEPPHLIRPKIGAALSKVICRMLAKEPADRQPDAETVIRQLRAALDGAPQSSGKVLRRGPGVRPTPTPSPTGVAPQLVRYLIVLIMGLLAGWLLKPERPEMPSTHAPAIQSQAPDLIPKYIQAIERDDLAAAFEVLTQHLAQHPRDWEMRSKRIEHARQLERMVEAFPDLIALDNASKLSDMETEILMGFYLKLDQHQQASKLMQRTVRHKPKLASQLAQAQARQLLAADKPFAAARAWLQAPRASNPGQVFVSRLDRELRRRQADSKLKPPADLHLLLLNLTLRDSRFFYWPLLADWLAADLRRVEQLKTKLLEQVLAESCRGRNWYTLGRAAGKALQAKDRARAAALAEQASGLVQNAYARRRWREALRLLTRRIWLMPEAKSAAALLDRASVYSKLRQDEYALADYKEILRIQPYHLRALTRRARILNDQGQYQLVIRELTAGLKTALPGNEMLPYCLKNRAMAYLLTDKPREARADFERALRLMVNRKANPTWKIGLALARAADGEEAAGRTTLTQLLHSKPRYSLLNYGRRLVDIELGTRMIALLPKHPLAHAERGNLMVHIWSKYSAGLRDLERAIELCTDQHARYRAEIDQTLTQARRRWKRR